jgi:hypothetical protein
LAEFSKELTLEKSVRTNTRENKDILNSGFIYVLGAVVVRANALSIILKLHEKTRGVFPSATAKRGFAVITPVLKTDMRFL